jgi:hypothetical protein
LRRKEKRNSHSTAVLATIIGSNKITITIRITIHFICYNKTWNSIIKMNNKRHAARALDGAPELKRTSVEAEAEERNMKIITIDILFLYKTKSRHSSFQGLRQRLTENASIVKLDNVLHQAKLGTSSPEFGGGMDPKRR